MLTSTRTSLQQTRRVFKWDKADYINLAIDFENFVPDSFNNDELSQDLEAMQKQSQEHSHWQLRITFPAP